MKHFPILISAIYCLYLGVGGVIFMNLEWNAYTTHTITDVDEWASLKEFLSSATTNQYGNSSQDLLSWLLDRCPTLKNETVVLNFTAENRNKVLYTIEEKCSNLSTEVSITSYNYPWSYIDALYFSMTVVTTIGYGHISPSTTCSRVACIIYAIIGIPFTMVLLTWTSDFFGEILFLLFQARLDKDKQSSKIFIALGTTFYICVGFLVFIFLPPILFMHIEHWTYFEGVYFSFITLTTIGFGDFVTGKTVEGPLLYVYQIAIIIWIMSGLGYWVMIANFISRAIRSKKIQMLAKKATDIRKLINQVSMSQPDSTFLTQHSKSSLNFLMQLCTTLIAPDMVENGAPFGNTGTRSAQPALLGISSLFGNSGFGELLNSLSPQLNSLDQENLQILASENSGDVNKSGIDTEKPRIFLKNLHSKKKGINPAFTCTSEEDLKKDFMEVQPHSNNYPSQIDPDNLNKSSEKSWRNPRSNSNVIYPEISGEPSRGFHV